MRRVGKPVPRRSLKTSLDSRPALVAVNLTWLAQLQAYRFGAKFSTPAQALSLQYHPEGEYRGCLETEGCGAVLRAKAVLITTGAEYGRLQAEGREQFEGVGVYYAATALEGQLCRNETVVVAGSGNSAGQAAMFLSEGAAKVLLVVRGNNIASKMSDYLSRRVQTQENIEILYNTEIRKMSGGKKLEQIELENTKTGERRSRSDAGGFFHDRRPPVHRLVASGN